MVAENQSRGLPNTRGGGLPALWISRIAELIIGERPMQIYGPKVPFAFGPVVLFKRNRRAELGRRRFADARECTEENQSRGPMKRRVETLFLFVELGHFFGKKKPIKPIPARMTAVGKEKH